MTKKAFCLNVNDFIPKITATIVSELIKEKILTDNESLAHKSVKVIMDVFTKYFEEQCDSENSETVQ